jgi:predicted RNA-binding Zn ribbon-like protein
MSSESTPATPAWMQRPAPAELALLQAFVNTHRYAAHADELDTLTSARRWLSATGPGRHKLDIEQLRELSILRETIRTLLLSHAGHEPIAASAAQLDRILGNAVVYLVIDHVGRAAPVARGRGLEWFMNQLAVQILTASLSGTWPRMKACGNDECRVAFYDHSRNGTARYCTSAQCANRVRQRTFRKRAAAS